MKYLLLISTLIFSVCYGQDATPFDSSLKIMQGLGLTPPTTQDTMNFLLYDSGWSRTQPAYHRKQDTIKCFVLYSDTTLRNTITKDYHTIVENKFGIYEYKKDTSYYINYQVYPSYFYSIRELHNTGEYSIDPGSCSGCYHDYYQHIQYLDKNKQKLSLNIVVWQAIEVK